ncbi:MAG: hypothetical protein GWM92_20460, partial [Gemmatimonadetes bacterium]|nr:hypothetical protein [Gemmatimonadota bacterium]NIR81206.1 hypothetical protein [Gemmatimonadota bacterium]NIT90054.1 hypothetical protein [Gemmatimonadota bacterium]NIU33863.1 hypothetical protein [Gemmatimonadota bacterium]NIU38060.1 hypothetical protein [Gemmatimonadota bacterium]
MPPLRLQADRTSPRRSPNLSSPLAAGLAAALLLLVPAGDVHAQSTVPSGPSADHPDLLRAEEAYFRGEPGEGIARLERLLARDPEAYDVLWRAAWFSLAAGLLEETTAAQNRWFRRGAAYARRARTVRPRGTEGRYWLVANLGLHAVQAGSAREMAELGEEVYRESRRLLGERPRHGGAHNVLGRTHFEVMSLSAFSRLLGRLFLGGNLLGQASWEKARFHLERAVQLDPRLVYFRLDLARLHQARGRSRLARRHACRALALPALHPPDPKLKRAARRLL